MTEKQYGGNTGRAEGDRSVNNLKTNNEIINQNKAKKSDTPSINKSNKINSSSSKESLSDKEKIIQAGKISSEVKKYAASIIKKGVSLLEIAEKIEKKIEELGGKPAFPVNLSIDNIAAHYTPGYDDKTTASGLLKIDIGVHLDGWIADTAFSMDLENNEENKKLIEASKKALEDAIKIAKKDVLLSDIGKIIQDTISSFGFSPVINLSGHGMEQYKLHSGITIPNTEDKKNISLKEELYAIEPFATTGSGRVHDGKPSGIYELREIKNVRSPIAREVLEFIIKEYSTLPFCSRWIVKKLGTKALFGLKQLEENGNLHHYSQLVEILGSKVSQAEQTILIEKDNTIVTTE
ncbi:MAG: type II methionyl aminopeptidase [Nanoarchaeota archaeon]